jgi:hypothetical protein
MIKTWGPLFQKYTRKGRASLSKYYGKAHADRVQYAELFEICEYGRQPNDADIHKIFPFLPPKPAAKRKQ